MRKNQLIGERYRIIKSLGEGGMANVYQAHDIILDRDVSLKLMRFDMQDDEKTRRRFSNEIEATSSILHPNIIEVYDYGEEGGSQYLVTEFVAGMDLKRYIAQNWPIPVSRIIDIMREILAGIAVAHQAGIIHRDLKPQNILISNDGEAKISDFGIARAQSSFGMTQTNTAIGSVHYMSPEQVRGDVASNRSDIYSLGIMLFEMITGHVPFDGETAVAIAVKHTQSPMPSVRDVDPRVPQALENVIFKATAKNPMSRYASAQAMSEDLATALSANRINEPRWHDSDITSEDNTVTKIIPLADIQSKANQQPIQTSTNEVKATAEQTPLKSQTTSAKVTPKPKPNRKKRRYFLGVIILIVALLVGFFIYGAMQPDKVHVSDVKGMTQANAIKTIKEDGLKVGDITETRSDTIEQGKVVKTDPTRNKAVPVNTVINLVVSKGSAKVRFGDYVNEKYSSVREQLEDKGYKVSQKKIADDTVPKGYIVEQNINAEDRVLPNKTKVKFSVSKGPKKHTVPDFTGKSQNAVLVWAQNNGVMINFDSVNSNGITRGKVVSQSIAPGIKVSKNETMLVTLSKGPVVTSSSVEERPSESRQDSSNSASTSSSVSDDDDDEKPAQSSESSQSSGSSETTSANEEHSTSTPPVSQSSSSVDSDDD